MSKRLGHTMAGISVEKVSESKSKDALYSIPCQRIHPVSSLIMTFISAFES